MATITLRPNGNSSVVFTPSAGTNWENVDETSSDGDTTYNSHSGGVNVVDVFTIESNSLIAGDTITNVSVYVTSRATSAGRLITASINTRINENSVSTNGSSNNNGTTYAEYSTSYNNRPSDSASWTNTDITNLLIGYNGGVQSTNLRVTQVYVVVTYTPAAGGSSASSLLLAGD